MAPTFPPGVPDVAPSYLNAPPPGTTSATTGGEAAGLSWPPPSMPTVPAFSMAPPEAVSYSDPGEFIVPAQAPEAEVEFRSRRDVRNDLSEPIVHAVPEVEQDSRVWDGTGPDPELIAALEEVVRLGASDLHVSVKSSPMVRVDGGLRAAGIGQLWDAAKVASALRSILKPEQREAFDENLEFDFAYTISTNARFRVNFYQQRGSMGAAFRLIPTEIKQLDQLGVPETVAQFAGLPRGLVLVTGPTGSGKSTTLAALIDLVNRTRADHIMTVEDPIEFIHPNHRSLVNQREVGSDTHSFGAALKHVLRQDPDVILIGELRDLETISVALTAAETGHLVFATLHTQDASQTVDRIIDVFPPHAQGQVRTQLAATLQGVVCQALVKRASGKGRVVATEVMVATPAIANLIREGKTYQIPSAMQAGRGLGMQTMDQHLADLVNSGDVTYEAAIDKVHDHEGFKQLVHRAVPLAAEYATEFSTDFGTE
jgi:twitching motility protein PilT